MAKSNLTPYLVAGGATAAFAAWWLTRDKGPPTPRPSSSGPAATLQQPGPVVTPASLDELVDLPTDVGPPRPGHWAAEYVPAAQDVPMTGDVMVSIHGYPFRAATAITYDFTVNKREAANALRSAAACGFQHGRVRIDAPDIEWVSLRRISDRELVSSYVQRGGTWFLRAGTDFGALVEARCFAPFSRTDLVGSTQYAVRG